MNTERTNTQAYEQDNRAYWREHVYDYGDFYRVPAARSSYRPRHEIRYWRWALLCLALDMAVLYWLT